MSLLRRRSARLCRHRALQVDSSLGDFGRSMLRSTPDEWHRRQHSDCAAHVLLPVQGARRPFARRLRCGTASWKATLATGKAPVRTLSEV